MADQELPDVDMALLRAYVAVTVEQEPDPARRVALTAALERGDASLHELDDGYIGVKVMGRQFVRVHRSRLRRPEAN